MYICVHIYIYIYIYILFKNATFLTLYILPTCLSPQRVILKQYNWGILTAWSTKWVTRCKFHVSKKRAVCQAALTWLHAVWFPQSLEQILGFILQQRTRVHVLMPSSLDFLLSSDTQCTGLPESSHSPKIICSYFVRELYLLYVHYYSSMSAHYATKDCHEFRHWHLRFFFCTAGEILVLQGCCVK